MTVLVRPPFRWTVVWYVFVALMAGLAFCQPARAQEACLNELVAKKAPQDKPFVVVTIIAGAGGGPATYQIVQQKNCKDGGCTHIYASLDAGLLPSGKIQDVKPAPALAFADGACKSTPVHFTVYPSLPAPASTCEKELLQKAEKSQTLLFAPSKDAPYRLLRASDSCADATCIVRYVTLDDRALPASAVAWADVCENKARHAQTGGPAAPTPPAGAPELQLGWEGRAAKILEDYRKSTPKAASDTRLVIGPEGALVAPAAAAQASAAAGEVLQILGQIVADRASEAAYQRARSEILKGLACETDTDKDGILDMADACPADKGDKSEDAAKNGCPAGGAATTKAARLRFPRTCRTISTLRLQELAMSQKVLVSALVSDVLYSFQRAITAPGASELNVQAMIDLMADQLLPEIMQVAGASSSSAPSAIVWQIVDQGLTRLAQAGTSKCTDDACKAIVLSATALIQCRLDAVKAPPKERSTTLQSCPIEDVVSEIAQGSGDLNAATTATAKRIALDLLQAQTAVTSSGKPDSRARARFAVHAAFDVGCMYLSPKELKNGTCPAQLEPEEAVAADTADKKAKLVRRVASLSRLLIIAAIDGDTNTVLAGLSKAVDVVVEQLDGAGLSDAQKKDLKKGLRLTGAVLQYAETFVNTDKDSTNALHERRTKILESLTREMTNREGREDDNILSLGGSLRALLGVRLDPGGEKPMFLGPLSLPLGVGFQSSGGLHLEIGIFDLGQYVSYQSTSTGFQVRQPEPVDVFAPSLSVGYYWGKSFPFFIAATAGYSPSYTFSKDATKTYGSVNLGLTSGVYVPLLDIN